jgi:hypothetical protein
VNGPLETEQQARELPEVRAIHRAATGPAATMMKPLNLGMLERACAAARVELGAYDRRILAWLANYEPQTCAVVAGLITRASGERL